MHFGAHALYFENIFSNHYFGLGDEFFKSHIAKPSPYKFMIPPLIFYNFFLRGINFLQLDSLILKDNFYISIIRVVFVRENHLQNNENSYII